MEKILTISIAAYNVENYIKKTLDSLIIEEILPKLEITSNYWTETIGLKAGI